MSDESLQHTQQPHRDHESLTTIYTSTENTNRATASLNGVLAACWLFIHFKSFRSKTAASLNSPPNSGAHFASKLLQNRIKSCKPPSTNHQTPPPTTAHKISELHHSPETPEWNANNLFSATDLMANLDISTTIVHVEKRIICAVGETTNCPHIFRLPPPCLCWVRGKN